MADRHAPFTARGAGVRLVAVCLWAALAAVGCRQGMDSPGERPRAAQPAPERAIEEVLADHNPSLLSLPGVVGTAVGDAEGVPAILVFVDPDSSGVTASLPEYLEGHPVVVQYTGGSGGG